MLSDLSRCGVLKKGRLFQTPHIIWPDTSKMTTVMGIILDLYAIPLTTRVSM